MLAKNVTTHRMLKKVSQMNCQINSFTNMYDMLWANFDCLAGKFNFVKKKNENTENNGQLFGYADFGGLWTTTQ